MRVKVGDQWFDSRKTPVMVEVTEKDRYNLKYMPEENYRYAEFPDDWQDVESRQSWMKK